jgi:hypothetical protein
MLMPHCREQYGQCVRVGVPAGVALGLAIDVTGDLLSGGGPILERDRRHDRQVGGDQGTPLMDPGVCHPS